jgi:hypothetical protein
MSVNIKAMLQKVASGRTVLQRHSRKAVTKEGAKVLVRVGM